MLLAFGVAGQAVEHVVQVTGQFTCGHHLAVQLVKNAGLLQSGF